MCMQQMTSQISPRHSTYCARLTDFTHGCVKGSLNVATILTVVIKDLVSFSWTFNLKTSRVMISPSILLLVLSAVFRPAHVRF